MDWIGLKADIERGTIANWKHLPTSEIEQVARLALAGKALAEAVRGLLASDTGSALPGDPYPTVDALAAWDAIDKEGA